MPKESLPIVDRYLKLVTLERERHRVGESLRQAERNLRETVDGMRAAVAKNSSGEEYRAQINERHLKVELLGDKYGSLVQEITELESELPQVVWLHRRLPPSTSNH